MLNILESNLKRQLSRDERWNIGTLAIPFLPSFHCRNVIAAQCACYGHFGFISFPFSTHFILYFILYSLLYCCRYYCSQWMKEKGEGTIFMPLKFSQYWILFIRLLLYPSSLDGFCKGFFFISFMLRVRRPPPPTNINNWITTKNNNANKRKLSIQQYFHSRAS